MKEKLSVQAQRQLNQYNLDTFTHDKQNILDYPVDKLIQDLKKQVNDTYVEHDKWIELEQNNPNRFKELDEKANLTGHSLHLQMYSYIQDVIYLEDELFALFEMKVIYAFKHLEINIKQLLLAAYQENYINRQFKWDTIVSYLNSKNINAKELNDYNNINELRNVNNSLKHSDRVIDQSIKNIPEFKDKETLHYSDLEAFYNRVKNSPNFFLTSLISFVFKDLYAFPHERVSELAKSFATRMDKKDALQFVDELLKYYE
jgi:hypothetical protein